MNLRRTAAGLAAVALTVSLSACGGEEAEPETTAADSSAPAESPTASAEPTQEETSAAASTEAAPETAPGAWIDYATYQEDPSAYADSDVVLFFYASWCPDCTETEASLDADGAPDGLTVVQVDFDDNTELRQQYGVTVQHTFVQIDDKGAELSKWTGSTTGADIAAEI